MQYTHRRTNETYYPKDYKEKFLSNDQSRIESPKTLIGGLLGVSILAIGGLAAFKGIQKIKKSHNQRESYEESESSKSEEEEQLKRSPNRGSNIEDEEYLSPDLEEEKKTRKPLRKTAKKEFSTPLKSSSTSEDDTLRKKLKNKAMNRKIAKNVTSARKKFISKSEENDEKLETISKTRELLSATKDVILEFVLGEHRIGGQRKQHKGKGNLESKEMSNQSSDSTDSSTQEETNIHRFGKKVKPVVATKKATQNRKSNRYLKPEYSSEEVDQPEEIVELRAKERVSKIKKELKEQLDDSNKHETSKNKNKH